MEYEIRKEDNFTIVALKGEVDLHYSPTARRQILDHLNANENVLVDLANVEYIDSSGVASLVEGYQLANTKKLSFGLVSASEAAIHVLKLARLDRIFPIYDSVGDAIAGSQK
jgi:anti-sigma B factor antagonist